MSYRSRNTRTRVSTMEADKYPLILIITQDDESKTKPKVHEIIDSSTAPDAVVNHLMSAIQLQEAHRAVLISEECDRRDREQLRTTQRREYEQSMQRDVEAREKQKEDQLKKQAEEQEKRQQEIQKEKDQNSANDRVEAAQTRVNATGTAENSITFRVKTPNGENFQRKFLNSESVEILFAWAATLSFFDCALNSTFPRLRFSEHRRKTLRDLKLGKQVSLILENNEENESSSDEDTSD